MGARDAVLAKLNVTADDNVFDRLAQVLATAPNRVVILDQFDEFQIEHRDRFIPERGQVISRARLEERNLFFASEICSRSRTPRSLRFRHSP